MARERTFAVVPAAAFSDRRLNLTALRVLGVIASRANRERVAFPSKQWIASTLGVSRSTVMRATALLVATGHLSIEPRFREKGGGQTSNGYRVLFEPQTEPQAGVVTGGPGWESFQSHPLGSEGAPPPDALAVPPHYQDVPSGSEELLSSSPASWDSTWGDSWTG